MNSSTGRHRRTRTFSVAAAIAVAAGAGGVYVGLDPHDASATTTVTVDTTAELQSAVANAAAGTVIQARGGTYHPTATLKSQADGTAANRITFTAYGSERVRIDGSKLPDGDWLAAVGGDHWTVRNLTFVNAPAQGFVATSSVGGVFENLTTANNGDTGFTLRGDGTSDNLVKNLDSYGNYDPDDHGQNADGLAVKFGSGTNNKVVGARLYNNADDGVDLWQWASPVRIERSWAYGNGVNRWKDTAFEGNGNGFKLGGGGATAAHVIVNNAAWDNTHGFTENSNRGVMRLHRNTAYANSGSGFYFATGKARLARNLAASNDGGMSRLGRSALSAANSWDRGTVSVAAATPKFRSTDPTTAYGPRKADGSLPATRFLTTGSAAMGAPMN